MPLVKRYSVAPASLAESAADEGDVTK